MTDDDEKDADCKKRNGFACIRVPRPLYDAAAARGTDMRDFVVQEKMPRTFRVWRATDE